MLERTDTRPNIITPGKYSFTVSKVPVKKMNDNSKVFYEFEFEYIDGTDIKTYKERFMSWLVGPLLKAMGFKEVEPKVFEWEREEAKGKVVDATIIHEEDKKEKGKFWPRMTEISEHIPF
jgi:hypothetical protein